MVLVIQILYFLLYKLSLLLFRILELDQIIKTTSKHSKKQQQTNLSIELWYANIYGIWILKDI